MIFTQKKSELTKKRENGLTILYTILTVVFISAFLFANLFSKPFDTAYKKLCNEAEKLHHSTIVLQQRIIDEVEKNKRQELILQHQSKLSALGELLSAITHQWRHPITRISLLLQNLRINLKMTKKLDDETDAIILSGYEQIDFLSETIENFKNFYKFDDKKELFSLREALTSVINIMCDIFDFHTIKLHIELDDTLKIYGNKVAFSHVFLNIMNNSKDEIVQRKIKNPRIHIVSKVRSNHITIFIYDNAGGVIGTSVNKIFDPYISTKAKEGSGMGLYIARAIVEEKFKGTIIARNIENGLLFRINLEQHKV
jgi:signal transduction histidine kinase